MCKLSVLAVVVGLFLAACASSDSGNAEVYGEVKGGIEHSHSH